ncbi:MAG: hypothetical protein M1828_000774 [Chrysothrix sp. TS-e1954]|nr:MAG: hypothetical protein M1828_000774 [Chrysothrix sp. TS-e1954]
MAPKKQYTPDKWRNENPDTQISRFLTTREERINLKKPNVHGGYDRYDSLPYLRSGQAYRSASDITSFTELPRRLIPHGTAQALSTLDTTFNKFPRRQQSKRVEPSRRGITTPPRIEPNKRPDPRKVPENIVETKTGRKKIITRKYVDPDRVRKTFQKRMTEVVPRRAMLLTLQKLYSNNGVEWNMDDVDVRMDARYTEGMLSPIAWMVAQVDAAEGRPPKPTLDSKKKTPTNYGPAPPINRDAPLNWSAANPRPEPQPAPEPEGAATGRKRRVKPEPTIALTRTKRTPKLSLKAQEAVENKQAEEDAKAARAAERAERAGTPAAQSRKTKGAAATATGVTKARGKAGGKAAAGKAKATGGKAAATKGGKAAKATRSTKKGRRTKKNG